MKRRPFLLRGLLKARRMPPAGGQKRNKGNGKKTWKMEVAGEIGVPLTNGYNGNLTFAQNGSVGGYMVKKMIEAQERQMANK